MSVNSDPQAAPSRPRLWWWLVIACTGLYVLLLASNYFRPWLTGTRLILPAAAILLVAFAVFAAGKDLSAAGPHRPLRTAERIVLMLVVLLVLVWVVGLLLATAASPGGRASALWLFIGLMVAIPVLPIAALALPGTILFRRIRRA